MNYKEYLNIAQRINQHFNEMDSINKSFSEATNTHCISNCSGQCCKNKDIEVNPVELLPLIIELHKKDILLTNYFLAKSKIGDYCLFFQNNRCAVYENRAVLCRLFGYASVYNKNKERVLSLCSLIKENENKTYSSEEISLAANMVDLSSQVKSLIPAWNNNPMKINEAFIYASERFMNSIQYEEIEC